MGGPNVAITGKLVMMASGPKLVLIIVKKYLIKLQIKYFFWENKVQQIQSNLR